MDERENCDVNRAATLEVVAWKLKFRTLDGLISIPK